MGNHEINTILFAAPKRGGILQSSGFLDLKSLMALSQTCKSNALDELSLIQLIENEMTRKHGVVTMQEAIDFWTKVSSRENPLLKQWLERDGCGRSSSSSSIVNDVESITITHDMLSAALPYEAMFVKMLRAVPTHSERLQLVSRKCEWTEVTLLHSVAEAGHLESLKAILALYAGESERLQAVGMRDSNGCNVLHFATYSGNAESIRLILTLYSETERLLAVKEWFSVGTALHIATRSGNFESIETILDVYPSESERLQALNVTNCDGETVLHYAANLNNLECIKAVLSTYPESERMQAVSMQDLMGKTVLDSMKPITRNSILEWLS